LNSWFEKTVETYKFAASAKDYSDLGGQKPPLLRCRTFLAGTVFFALSSFAFLLFCLNLNVLNMERRPSTTDGVGDTAMDFAENIAAALPIPSLHNLVISRQFEVLAVSFVGSFFGALALCCLTFFGRPSHISRKTQVAISSLIVSLGLTHFGCACVLLSGVLLIGRVYGFDAPIDTLMMSAIVILPLVLAPLATYCVRKWCGSSDTRALGRVRSVAWYSMSGPLMVAFILMFNAMWVDGRFKPQLSMTLSANCAQPEKGACVVTFKPRDIDGKVAVLRVRGPIILGYQDEASKPGRHTEAGYVSFDVIQSPDTPLPMQVSSDVVTGVVGKVKFDCPKDFVGGSRKLDVSPHDVIAEGRILDGPQFGNPVNVRVQLVWPFELSLLLKGHANGCDFFP